MYKLFYTNPAKEDLRKFDLKSAKAINAKMMFFARQDNVFRFAKHLKNYISGVKCYRFRIGVYRAIFVIEPDGCIQILMILRIKHRKDIYSR